MRDGTRILMQIVARVQAGHGFARLIAGGGVMSIVMSARSAVMLGVSSVVRPALVSARP